ncbi:MAG: pyridoxal-phosphate dependent enzyme [Lachnospiraceae bacterium]|nr:pyridoxal-phosphate dependent enzyme [Lachnospiraceae bacterium]
MSQYYQGIRCIKCGHPIEEKEAFDGCPVCRGTETSVNGETWYEFGQDKEALRKGFGKASGPGLWAHREFLPVREETKPVTLGEGKTPLLPLLRLGERIGIPNLYVKVEGMNPTWSYKDRLCSVGVTKALEAGAPAITVSSTGNHGAATAAYAAAAGLPCVVFTLESVPETMKTLMQSYGAYVFALKEPSDRWKIMKRCVKEFGWYPMSGYVLPAMGSNCFGIDGYKTLTYEVFEDLGELPDQMIVPGVYGDGLYGIWKGVEDIHTLGLSEKQTKINASEVEGALAVTLQRGAEFPVKLPPRKNSVAFSISGGVSTYQSYAAVTRSGGYAEGTGEEEAMDMQALLGRTEGIYAEAASVTSLVTAAKFRAQGRIREDETVVAVLTSSGLKDPGSTAVRLPKAPLIEPDTKVLSEALKREYGITLF